MVIWRKQSQMKINIVINNTHDTNRLLCSFLFTADEVLRRVIEKHKASLKRKFENISEGIITPGAETPLNKIYTELYITEGESEG